MLYSLVGAALTVTYPFVKRFFPLPQFYLGAAFGWAVPMAFVATLGEVPRLGWLLFIVDAAVGRCLRHASTPWSIATTT